MENMIKYVVECDSWIGVIALLILCILLGFVAWLIYKAILYVVDKITTYQEIRAKVETSTVLVETELKHESNGSL